MNKQREIIVTVTYNDIGIIVDTKAEERKKGKWERHYCEDGNPDGWRCDKCDEWYYFGQTLPNFCPNCGADMRGEEDDHTAEEKTT